MAEIPAVQHNNTAQVAQPQAQDVDMQDIPPQA